MKDSWAYFLANEPQSPNSDLEVTDKFTGEVATRVAMADVDAIDSAIAAAVESAEPLRRMKPYERQGILNHCVQRFSERFDELAMFLCIEAGKPIKDSRGEVSRLIDTFRIAAEESVRMNGEFMRLWPIRCFGLMHFVRPPNLDSFLRDSLLCQQLPIDAN